MQGQGLYKIFKSLLIIIWIIDILNIDFIINDIHIATFIDDIIPLNGWFWFLVWLLMRSTSIIINKKEN